MQLTIHYGLKQVELVAHMILPLLSKYRVIFFKGDLGAGKTTLVRALLNASGIDEPITSPTFTYLNQYMTSGRQVIYHFDLYRVAHINDFMMLGFDEYLYQPNAWVIVEWPEVIEQLSLPSYCLVALERMQQETERMLYACIKQPENSKGES